MRHTALAVLALSLSFSPLQAQCESSSFKASDSGPNDRFGSAVSMDGTRAIVGRGSRLSALNGAAYVFEITGKEWKEVQILLPSDAGPARSFGASVALDGDLLVVGAPFDSPGGPPSGSAYVFERILGVWTEVAKLTSGNPGASSMFGVSVAVSGDRIVVGGPNLLSGKQGRVLVYERVANVWTKVANLKDHLGEGGDFFGDALALEGDRLLVGAPRADTAFGIDSGTALVFERLAGVWTFTQRLKSPGLSAQESLGRSVDLDGGRAAVGSNFSNDSGVFHAGAVSIFEDTGGVFVFTDELLPIQPVTWYQFGLSLALSGDRIIVGTAGDEVHAIERVGTEWTNRGLMRSVPGFKGNGGDFDFGWVLDMDGAVSLVGEPRLVTSSVHGSVAVFSWPDFTTTFCSCADGPRCDDPFAGCMNSTASGGSLRGCGSSSVIEDDLLLTAWRVPPGKAYLPLMGAGQVHVPFGDGLLCVGSGGVGLFRFPVKLTDTWGHAVLGPGIVSHSQTHFSAAGAIQPGSTWYFQFWYRDSLVTPCGGFQPVPKGFNLTDAIGVTFTL